MAMTAKQKEKFQSEWKKPGNVKKNEIMSPGAVARGIVQTVTPNIVRKIQGKRMVEQNKKTVNKIADIQQKVKAEKIAKNSVKTVKADPLSRASKNIKSNRKVQEAKSGDAAKRGAKDAAESNRRNSPYLENQTVRVKSGNAEPYKITGGAGSTARRTGEVIKRVNKKGKK